MKFQIRKQKILEKIETEGLIDVKEAAEILQTSEITIRRDLTLLADQGFLVRTHGGAMKVSLSQMPVDFAQKSAIYAAEKDAICRLAASFIEEGDVVFLDCGSTVFRLCPFIKNLSIQVVTNSLPIVNELIGTAVKLNFAGGEIDAERQAAHGTAAIQHFKRYRAHKAFVGIDGISYQNGLSANSEKEAEITMVMAQQAQTTYFLCDSSKLERDKYLPFAPIDSVQHLITDTNAPASIIEQYQKVGIKIWQAKP